MRAAVSAVCLSILVGALVLVPGAGSTPVDPIVLITFTGTWDVENTANPPPEQVATRSSEASATWSVFLTEPNDPDAADESVLRVSDLKDAFAALKAGKHLGFGYTVHEPAKRREYMDGRLEIKDTRPGVSCSARR